MRLKDSKREGVIAASLMRKGSASSQLKKNSEGQLPEIQIDPLQSEADITEDKTPLRSAVRQQREESGGYDDDDLLFRQQQQMLNLGEARHMSLSRRKSFNRRKSGRGPVKLE